MALPTYRQQTGILGATTTCPSCVTPIGYTAGSSVETIASACASTDITHQFYFTENIIATNATVYTDSGLSTVFVGNGGYYRIDNTGFIQIAQITNFGKVSSLSLCP